ncbi:glycosyltransferase family 61 protein [Paenibacillus ginsengihumi]|uniref:glycosyltransferase family 61 protein n=1 Tax=Paenibacillus ginsengihumi TaxID=431596 RepID=UPI00037BA85A|nr:glycosyltransferase family 61 protein [Paenibacillus ginsengihumi]
MDDSGKKRQPPDGYYLETREWVRQSAAGASLEQDLLMPLYEDETVLLAEPEGIDPPQWQGEFPVRQAFVAIVPNGRVWGLNGSVISPDNKLLWDVSDARPPESNEVFHAAELPPVVRSEETVATLAWISYNNYAHWLFDILPRLHLLQRSGIAIGQYIVNGGLAHPYQLETLRMLGIPESQIVFTSDTFHLEAKRLVVASIPNRLGYPGWVFDFLRRSFRDSQKIAPLAGYDRIYVSREDSAYRHVVNEDEVMQALGPLGFRKVVLGPLSFKDKMRLFASAQVIVAPLGAGLANVVFCRPGTKVMEFSNRSFVSTDFWKFSRYAGLQYYHMICEEETAQLPDLPKLHLDWHIWTRNIRVDPAKLLRLLAHAGIR